VSVRKLDDEIYGKLKSRAAEHGVSMEEEIRQILERAVSAPERLGDLALECFGPEHGVELELSPRPPHEPLILGSDEARSRKR
jgi:plasmid stability protein